mgnify:CR=1 FL=1
MVLATIDQKDADLEYRPVKMCEFVMAVGKNHHLATLAVAKEGFQYPWVDLKACEKEENVMLLPGSPFRQHADEIYGHYHLNLMLYIRSVGQERDCPVWRTMKHYDHVGSYDF